MKAGCRPTLLAAARPAFKLAATLVVGLTCALPATAAFPAGPTLDPEWHIPLAEADAGAQTAPAAIRLAAALEHYQSLANAGGWPLVPPDTRLQAGQRDPRVVELRERLRISGDFAGLPGTADAWYFDGGLRDALHGFQKRHGLPATGQVGAATVAALNVSAADRVAQLNANLIRWTWLPRDFGSRYLWVNVAGGFLRLVDGGKAVLEMRVIAGHPDRPTPSFVDSITALVVNPPWNVPRTIAVEDLLPWQQEDATFLARLGIRVFNSSGHEVDAARINWQQLDPDHFPYRLRQDPGPVNSLGRIKFVMQNPWSIYLHDTPSRRLFDLNSRTLSSGCVRLEKPEELAHRLLAGAASGEIDPQIVPAGVSADDVPVKTRIIPLPRAITVYVVYLTSWVTEQGVVNFRPDVYGRDAGLR
ncbi:MAG: L,D-transpeptidase family protein [Gammaproteobacteria bacterium]